METFFDWQINYLFAQIITLTALERDAPVSPVKHHFVILNLILHFLFTSLPLTSCMVTFSSGLQSDLTAFHPLMCFSDITFCPGSLVHTGFIKVFSVRRVIHKSSIGSCPRPVMLVPYSHETDTHTQACLQAALPPAARGNTQCP